MEILWIIINELCMSWEDVFSRHVAKLTVLGRDNTRYQHVERTLFSYLLVQHRTPNLGGPNAELEGLGNLYLGFA
jgi:hypothetical protein